RMAALGRNFFVRGPRSVVVRCQAKPCFAAPPCDRVGLERITVVLHMLKALSRRTPPNPPFARGGELRRTGPVLFPPLRRGGWGGGWIRVALGHALLNR